MNKEGMLSYYKEYEDRALINNIFQYAEKVDHGYVCFFTDFLDPRQIAIAMDVIENYRDKRITFFGGVEDAERNIVCVHHIDMDINAVKPPISIVNMSWRGGKELTHRDFLGTLIGQGVKRDKIGDIYVQGKSAYVILDEVVADYINSTIEKIGGEKVSCKIVDSADCVEKRTKLFYDTVASLRLDVVVSSGFNISRGDAADLIKGGKAFINWRCETSISRSVKENDAITLRGKGRLVLDEIMGTTKKERYRICIKKYV